MNEYYQQPYQQQPYYNYAANYGYQPYVMNPPMVPQNVNALSDDEIKVLESAKPSSILDINVDPNDVLRSMCTHKKNGVDMVRQVNDGTEDVWCPICNARWDPNMCETEELEAAIKLISNQMQNAKWIGDLPVQITRDFFPVDKVLEKFPKIYDYAAKNFNKYYNQNSIVNAADATPYNAYNSLFGNTYSMYQQPQYYQQQACMPMAPQPPQPGLYYNQANMDPMHHMAPQPMANPYANPMQTPYGVNPMAPNQQFVQQTANMMPQAAPQQQPVGYNGMQAPQAAPQQQPQAAAMPTFATPQPQAYQPQPTPETTETKQQTISI